MFRAIEVVLLHGHVRSATTRPASQRVRAARLAVALAQRAPLHRAAAAVRVTAIQRTSDRTARLTVRVFQVEVPRTVDGVVDIVEVVSRTAGSTCARTTVGETVRSLRALLQMRERLHVADGRATFARSSACSATRFGTLRG